ncbi:Gfo/Idh/MocA family protein [Chitinophaga caseinilytica]|uniref:Gfo/Idh/MocA family protein n=1 Tax=Chitinophaga caseinilytica TaxID=2267521 RepID=UPI003C2EDE83
MQHRSIFLLSVLFFLLISDTHAQAPPLRVAVAGISHGHSGWILGRTGKPDIEVAGIWEPDTALAAKAARQYNIPRNRFYTNLAAMLDALKPEAVLAFGSVYAHLEVTEACAPRGIHVMVEKPLAANLAHARKMEALARKHRIHLLTNYETSWYPSVHKSLQLALDSNYTGTLRMARFNHGHQGPKEIGCSPEFLAWLTDPVLNGAGALTDFGCYGANIMTALMRNEAPVSVTAVTRRFKPEVYPKVDDDATIVVDYPGAQAVIQASWNWTFNRKDMELYGTQAALSAPDAATLIRRGTSGRPQETKVTPEELKVYTDPFVYLAAVVKGKETVAPWSLYSLENNVMVVRILEAAKISAKTGKSVPL